MFYNIFHHVIPVACCDGIWYYDPFWRKRKIENFNEKLFYFLKIASIWNGCILLIFSTIIHHPLFPLHILSHGLWLWIWYLCAHRCSFIQQSKHSNAEQRNKILKHLQHMFQHPFDSFSKDIAICVVDIEKQIEFGKWGFLLQPIATNNRIIIRKLN